MNNSNESGGLGNGSMRSSSGTVPAQSNVTQLDFNQAMTDFKIMFPDMPEDIIEAVLRSNKGVVDATIDELLRIASQNNPDDIEKASSVSQISTNSVSRTQSKSLFNSTNNFYNAQTDDTSGAKCYSKNFLQFNDKISKDSLRYRNNWNPPMLGELPVGFLRISLNETQRKLTNAEHSNTNSTSRDASLINSTMLQQKMEENERNRQIASADDPELAQFLADERFAILLQNEEFVRELRLNQDFMSTLENSGIPARPG